jgi:SAM-dependent methyltransferase
MDRRAWLDEQRGRIEEGYDLYAPTFDDSSPIEPTHRQFVEKVIESCPEGGAILDAPCGTGRYFELVLAAGLTVVGADQSAGMLSRAREEHQEVWLEKVGLQELDFDDEFDGVLCIDAMEFVFPEDWPKVLANLHQAVRGAGFIYMTVEQIDPDEIASSLAEAAAGGLPVVHGETRRGGGYHYYPTPERVLTWLEREGLEVVDRELSDARTYAYLHLLVRERP